MCIRAAVRCRLHAYGSAGPPKEPSLSLRRRKERHVGIYSSSASKKRSPVSSAQLCHCMRRLLGPASGVNLPSHLGGSSAAHNDHSRDATRAAARLAIPEDPPDALPHLALFKLTGDLQRARGRGCEDMGCRQQRLVFAAAWYRCHRWHWALGQLLREDGIRCITSSRFRPLCKASCKLTSLPFTTLTCGSTRISSFRADVQ